MEKEFIPYEQALALKKLGFDEPCFGFYIYNNKLLHLPKFIESWNGNENRDKNISHSAPLYQQAFRWFIDNYEILYSIQYSRLPNRFWFKIFDAVFNDVEFKTYEEAELECIKKLIEIVKNK